MDDPKPGREPSEPSPYFRWVDDECAGIMCGCGEEMSISTNWPQRCPKCKRAYLLQQRNWIEERDPETLNVCPFCGGARTDTGSYCPECKRDADGKTWEDRRKELIALQRTNRGSSCP